MRVDFAEVSLTGTKTVRCAACGKPIRRQKRFWQTINPFNRRADGAPKSRSEITAELRREIEVWRAQAETCAKCTAESGGGSDAP